MKDKEMGHHCKAEVPNWEQREIPPNTQDMTDTSNIILIFQMTWGPLTSCKSQVIHTLQKLTIMKLL